VWRERKMKMLAWVVWMGASGRRKHTIRVLAADWSNDRRCGSRPSEIQLYAVFDGDCFKQPTQKRYFLMSVA
jgi:hypothetical protein